MTGFSLHVRFPDTIKDDLRRIAKESGVPMNSLVSLATQSLVVNYQTSKTLIFSDILNSQYRNDKK